MLTGGRSRRPAWLLPSLRGYQRPWLARDVVAGLVLTAVLVPQGMAYAELAGLPPVTGLYTSILCLIGYALVGPSRLLVLGPDSSLGPMIAATILPLVGANGDPARAVVLASALALITGALMVVAGATGLGFVADLLSRPTILGYMNGLALTIVVGQLPKLFGFSVDADGFLAELWGFVKGVATGEVLVVAAVVGVASLLTIVAVGRWLPRVPAVLIAVVLALLVCTIADLAAHGLPVVGSLPPGLPAFDIPGVGFADLGLLVLGAVGISLVALADTISTATSFAARSGEEVDGGREMIGIGVANISAGLFQGFPVSTSGSRTAVAERSGARSQLAGLIGALMIGLMLVLLPDLLANLPQATLAAVVIAASIGLAGIPATVRLARQRPTDFVVALVAFLGVVLLGVLPGIVVAVAISVGNVFRRIWRPYRATLGVVDGIGGLHDITSYPHAREPEHCTVFRFDAPLIFANASTFRDEVRRQSKRLSDGDWLILAAEPMTDIDTTACDMLDDLVVELDAEGVRLVFAELKDRVRAKLHRYGLEPGLADDRFFPTIESAVEACQRAERSGS